HEHSNIVQYYTIFLEKIKDLETLMAQFVGNNIEIVINSEIIWALLDIPPLRKKVI
ncbi:20000_t:CDS:2, partial [Gigaspora margarita]